MKSQKKQTKMVTKRNIKKVQGVTKRKSPGAGGGKFYRVEIRPKGEFITFRTQDVGKKDGLERIAGKKASGGWDTATWLIEKNKAHVSHDKLVIDDPKVKTVLKQIRGPIMHKKGDVFTAMPKYRKTMH
jgi:hypothetical protein